MLDRYIFSYLAIHFQYFLLCVRLCAGDGQALSWTYLKFNRGTSYRDLAGQILLVLY